VTSRMGKKNAAKGKRKDSKATTPWTTHGRKVRALRQIFKR
jgi:hypothetical protein